VSLTVIFLLILVLASFVFTFLGARTWHWGQVLIVEGIFLATLGFFVLTAEVIRINKVLQTEHQRVEKELTDMKARNVALEKGSKDTNVINQMRNEDPPLKVAEEAESIPSLTDLEHRRLLMTRLRGRVWRNGKRTGDINPQSGEMTLSVDAPFPAGLKDTVVYVFEDGAPQLPGPDGTPRGPQYIGEFRVTKTAGQQATVVPARPMDNFEKQRLAASKLSWSIYETMPVDRHDVFSGVKEADLKKRLPPDSVGEYIRDGKDATKDDPADRQVGYDAEDKRLPPDKLSEAVKKKYSRRLRDYAVEFDMLSAQRIRLEADLAAVTSDIKRLVNAQASALKLQEFRKDEVAKLKTELAGVTKERLAIQKHLAQVEAQLARANQLLAEVLRRNSQIVRELSGRQAEPARPAGGAAKPSAPARGPLALRK